MPRALSPPAGSGVSGRCKAGTEDVSPAKTCDLERHGVRTAAAARRCWSKRQFPARSLLGPLEARALRRQRGKPHSSVPCMSPDNAAERLASDRGRNTKLIE